MEFPPKKANNNKRYCSVSCCNSSAKKRRDLVFHRFPLENEKTIVKVISFTGNEISLSRRKAWIYKLLVGKKVTRNMTVCSLHFTEEDYIYPNINRKKKSLKKNAVPSLNLPQKSHMPAPIKKRRIITKVSSVTPVQNVEPLVEPMCVQQIVEDEEIEPSNSLHLLSVNDLPTCSHDQDELEEIVELPKEFKEFGVQVSSGDFKKSFSSLIDSDVKLCKLTGLPTLKLLEFLVNKCKQHPNIKKSINLSIKDKILLTFIKLRHNLPNSVLTLLFDAMTEATCGNYIHEMLPVLCSILSTCIRWIGHEENQKNMPLCFEGFEDVVCILDCTEIPIEKPKCLCCRTKLYSHYKGGHTVKFLAGVSPGGLFTFVSAAYGGRNSDKGIFNHEEFLAKTVPGDAIMVDKGFLIETECMAKSVKLVRPPFLGSKRKQFSPEEALLNARIASARVHVERMFQRVKQFKILKEQLSCKLIHQVENIFKIICGIVNLSPPILSIDKFVQEKQE